MLSVLAVVRPTGVYLLDFFCSSIQFYVLLSPYLCFIFFISLFICFWRWCIDKLGVFHANQTYMSWSICELRVRLVQWYQFKPSSKIFYWPFQGVTSFVDHFLGFSCFRVCSLLPCGLLLGKGWPLGSCWRCLLYLVTFPRGILGQVWYLIVSFPDLCRLSYLCDHSKRRPNIVF